jgi:hypothetical protein
LSEANASVHDQFEDALQDFTQLLGWYIGIGPLPSTNSSLPFSSCGASTFQALPTPPMPETNVLFGSDTLLHHLQIRTHSPTGGNSPKVEFGMVHK